MGFPPIYVDIGVRTITPTAGPVSGVGSNVALAVGGGCWGPLARIGAEFEAGGANTCAACSPFSSRWSTLSGGVQALGDMFSSLDWALSAGVAFEYMVAFGPTADSRNAHLYRPGIHLSAARVGLKYMRLELDLSAEYWLADSPGCLAL